MSRMKPFTKVQIKLICEIAQEAHMRGRIYTSMGEKHSPVEEYERTQHMAIASAKSGRVLFNLAAIKAARSAVSGSQPTSRTQRD